MEAARTKSDGRLNAPTSIRIEQTSLKLKAHFQVLARNNTDLIAYVLYKPSPVMTDGEARVEASDTIDFLAALCKRSGVKLTIRLNPMYAATGTPWHEEAMAAGDRYSPPLLSDVVEVAKEKRARGVPVYLGLTSEGRAMANTTYKSRPEYHKDHLKEAIAMNMAPAG